MIDGWSIKMAEPRRRRGADPPDDSEDDGDDENDVATTTTPKKRKKRCENLAKRCENSPKRAENDPKTTRKQLKTIRKTYGKLAVLNVSRLRKSTIGLVKRFFVRSFRSVRSTVGSVFLFFQGCLGWRSHTSRWSGGAEPTPHC